MKKRRPYRMGARAEAAAQTGRDVLAATAALWRERALDEFTLQDIADRAGVSVQTVIRRFGSKDGVVEACIASDAAGIRAERDAAPAGEPDRALDVLLEHYERDGDAVYRTLALEHRLDVAAALLAMGRRNHRQWCARVFEPYLPPTESPDRDMRLDAFVAATDLYIWHLLRRDLGHSLAHTRAVMQSILNGLTNPT